MRLGMFWAVNGLCEPLESVGFGKFFFLEKLVMAARLDDGLYR